VSRTNCAIGREYVTASFKGVQFACTDIDIEGGRRGAEGEFPFGENTAYADLGRRIRVYHLTAVFREDSHVSDAQALFRVCESTGPGLLVHPTRGTTMAACRHVKIKDNQEEQGETTAELEFVEANQGAGGLAGSIFGLISTGLSAVSQTSFLQDYTPLAVAPPWQHDVIVAAQELVREVATTTQQTTPIDASAQDQRNILQMQEVADDVGLAANRVKVDQSLNYGFNAIAINLPDPLTRFKTMKRLANLAARTSILPTGVAADSEEAVLSRHRILAGIGITNAAMAQIYATVDEALTAMDQGSAVLEDEAKHAYDICDNVLFLELRNYITQFKQTMNDIAYRLPPLIAVDFNGGTYPLVAAYAIYNDAKKARDLEKRNPVDANGRFRPSIVVAALSSV
jgi:prophage DNA circulation protein